MSNPTIHQPYYEVTRRPRWQCVGCGDMFSKVIPAARCLTCQSKAHRCSKCWNKHLEHMREIDPEGEIH